MTMPRCDGGFRSCRVASISFRPSRDFGRRLRSRRVEPARYPARMPTVAERIGTGRFVSFELWPPRSPESAAALEAALDELTGWAPAFVAITYGAGGATRERTHDLVVRLVHSPLLPLAHLTCA